MPHFDTLEIRGKSGKAYRFGLYSLPFQLPTGWRQIAGVYIELGSNETGDREKIFVDETSDVVKRHANRLKEDSISRYDVDCIGFVVENSQAKRQAIKQDLLEEHDWLCKD